MPELKMTYQQYIDNPMGKSNATFSGRESMKAKYSEKYDQVMLRELGKIDYTLYVDKARDEYYCHMKIPSETVKGFYYDAVVQFYGENPALKTERNLRSYYVRFFSNDPAFMYTYFYVFWKNDMLIKSLLNKFPRNAKKTPDERNPYQVPGYVKSLYFMFLHMKARNLFMKAIYDAYAKPFNKARFAAQIRPAEKVLEERQELEENQKAQKLAERKAASKINANQNIRKIDQAATENMKRTKTVGKIGASKTIGNIGTVKRTKRIGKS